MFNYNGTPVNAFTQRMVARGRTLYEGMTAKQDNKRSIPQRSIRSQHGRGKRNPGIVWGQGYAYHGHVSH